MHVISFCMPKSNPRHGLGSPMIPQKNAQKNAKTNAQEILVTVHNIKAKSIVFFVIDLKKSITKSAIGFKAEFEHFFSQLRAKPIGPN